MKDKLTSINEELVSLKNKMKEIGSINVNTSSGLASIITSADQKETLLACIVGQLLETRELITQSGIMKKLKKRIGQVKTTDKTKLKKHIFSSEFSVKCLIQISIGPKRSSMPKMVS